MSLEIYLLNYKLLKFALKKTRREQNMMETKNLFVILYLMQFNCLLP